MGEGGGGGKEKRNGREGGEIEKVERWCRVNFIVTSWSLSL